MENRISGAFIYTVPFIVIFLFMILMLPIAVIELISYIGVFE